MEKITFQRFERALSMDKISIGDNNVRKTKLHVGLEELKAGIQKFGLIHPVIVIQENNHYKLIVGQRRFMAFEELKRNTIPALVVGKVKKLTQKVLSLGENIHRKSLPYSDTIGICDELYKTYSGSKFHRIKKIATDIAISPGTVSKYLAYKLVPKSVRDLVDRKKLSAELAYRLTTAFWPNEKKITNIANYITRMTKSESERALDLGKKNPTWSVGTIITEAKNPKRTFELVIHLDREKTKILENIAEERHTNVRHLVLGLINDLLDEEEEL